MATQISPIENLFGPILTNLHDVQELTQSWLWPGRISLGAITIVGYGGEEKGAVFPLRSLRRLCSKVLKT